MSVRDFTADFAGRTPDHVNSDGVKFYAGKGGVYAITPALRVYAVSLADPLDIESGDHDTCLGYVRPSERHSPPGPISADDMRHTFRICFQPSIVSDPVLLAQVIDNIAVDFIAARVSERRIRNQAAATFLPQEYVTRLLQRMAVLG